MALYDRILGLEGAGGKIPVHQFQSLCAEWARGNITAQQAQDAVTLLSGQPLTPAEASEAAALVATVPTGTTAALKADRALRLLEIDQVLEMADLRVPPYTTAAAIKTRLGV